MEIDVPIRKIAQHQMHVYNQMMVGLKKAAALFVEVMGVLN